MTSMVKLCFPGLLCVLLFGAIGCDDDDAPCDDVTCGANASCDVDTGECLCDGGWVWVEEVETCLEVMARLDDLELEEEGFYNGLDEAGSFTSGSVTFYNSYDTEYESWDGFAYSNMTDITTPGYENQYSAIVGGGAQDSENYAVAYVSDFSTFGPPTLEIGDGTETTTLAGLHVTNTTYAYLSMLDGDDYSKQFGGETGEDPDWFLLTIHGFDESGAEVGTVEVYLADYQSDVADEDYILDDWTWVDLSSLGAVASLQFTLTSSDMGDYGMNTPAYFALDSILR